MKVLLFNGSTRNNGCTYLALDQVAQTLRQAGIETELLQLGGKPVRDCLGCNRCAENGQCVFSEDVETFGSARPGRPMGLSLALRCILPTPQARCWR